MRTHPRPALSRYPAPDIEFTKGPATVPELLKFNEEEFEPTRLFDQKAKASVRQLHEAYSPDILTTWTAQSIPDFILQDLDYAVIDPKPYPLARIFIHPQMEDNTLKWNYINSNTKLFNLDLLLEKSPYLAMAHNLQAIMCEEINETSIAYLSQMLGYNYEIINNAMEIPFSYQYLGEYKELFLLSYLLKDSRLNRNIFDASASPESYNGKYGITTRTNLLLSLQLMGGEIMQLSTDLNDFEKDNRITTLPYFTRSAALYYDATVIKILTEYNLSS